MGNFKCPATSIVQDDDVHFSTTKAL